MGITMSEGVEYSALSEAVFYILLSLCAPMHGYGIMQNVAALSAGRVKLGPGTLYGALNTLLEKGWIRPLPAAEAARKKEYEIAPAGQDALRAELLRLVELLTAAQTVLGNADSESEETP